jgi:thiamine biosynthesis lipoprotein
MKLWRLVICLLVLLVCWGCGQKPTQLREFKGERFIMDTLVEITVVCEEQKGKAALEKAFAAFEKINDLTDRFPKDGQIASAASDVIRINENVGNKPVVVSTDTINIIQRSQYYAELSGGAFDITIGPVMDMWGFGKSGQQAPTDEEIKKALSLVDYRKVVLESNNGTIFLSNPDMSLDLGGVAKGYATDMAVKALRELGVKHAMINAGGNVYALGGKPDGSPWRVGVQDPRGDKGIIAILSLKDAAAVTSGDYQRYFEQGGVRYHHIIDPSTGKQAGGGMQTTVITDSATDADILSTLLFVLGPQQGMNFAKGLPGTGAIFVSSDKRLSFTDNLSERLELTGDGGYIPAK